MKTGFSSLVLLCQASLAASAVVRPSNGHASDNTKAALLAKRDHAAIEPTLSPESDHIFMKHDYKHDESPHARDVNFGYPYPVLQDTEKYDRDYVKDENNDGGEWKAQFEFDRLRAQLQKDRALVRETLAAEKGKKNTLDIAKVKEGQAERESKEAERKAEDAQRRYDSSTKDLEELTGKQDGKQDGGKIGKSVGEVNKEIADVEECEKHLREVQAKLKQLEEEREARKRAIAQSQQEAANSKAAADAKYQTAKEADYDKMDKDLIRQMQEKKRAREEAIAQARMSEAEMKKLEAQIKVAAENLRNARQRQAGNGGAVSLTHPTPAPEVKSSATGAAVPAALLVLTTLCLWA